VSVVTLVTGVRPNEQPGDLEAGEGAHVTVPPPSGAPPAAGRPTKVTYAKAREPADPAEECEPDEPTDISPVASAEARKPIEPAEARKPIEPAEARRPIEPAEARKPIEPAEARKPIEPAEARKPIEPAEARKPIEPITKTNIKPSLMLPFVESSVFLFSCRYDVGVSCFVCLFIKYIHFLNLLPDSQRTALQSCSMVKEIASGHTPPLILYILIKNIYII
jgi:hypothetical protein